MIKHIVMFRIKGNGENKKQYMNLLKDKLDELKNKIPVAKYLETGINFSQSPSAFDIILTCHFETNSDLETYKSHPDHQKVVVIINEIVSEVAVVDYFF